jgi:hypothetical protein|uniref:Uncharacterized protein n=1 Tax=Phaeodactylum tricornutum TaxID=2850 RepID=A0A8J9SXI4_PHATR
MKIFLLAILCFFVAAQAQEVQIRLLGKNENKNVCDSDEDEMNILIEAAIDQVLEMHNIPVPESYITGNNNRMLRETRDLQRGSGNLCNCWEAPPAMCLWFCPGGGRGLAEAAERRDIAVTSLVQDLMFDEESGIVKAFMQLVSSGRISHRCRRALFRLVVTNNLEISVNVVE